MVYVKKVQSTDRRFGGRDIVVSSEKGSDVIPVSDTVVLCNSCNKNVYPDPGYLVYLTKRELTQDLPYDFYCEECIKKYFPKAKEVS